MIYRSNSNLETQNIASKFSENLKAGDFIALNGELGAGKTTFVQGLAQGLKIKEKIISPTFILMRSYKIPESTASLIHIDLYRLETPEQIDQLGIKELLDNKSNIVVIEWADKLENLKPTIIININRISDNQREIEII